MFSNSNLSKFSSVPFTHNTLLSSLKDYKRPNDKISRLLASGELLQIKKGMYILGKEYRANAISLPLVANLINGPSYVSLDYALAWHGLIPETVFEVSSMTLGRTKFYHNQIGRFSYKHSFLNLYPIGLTIENNPDGSSFLIASSEKALCDKIIFTRKLKALNIKAMREFILEDLRIEPSFLQQLDREIIVECLNLGYKRQQLTALCQFLDKI